MTAMIAIALISLAAGYLFGHQAARRTSEALMGECLSLAQGAALAMRRLADQS